MGVQVVTHFGGSPILPDDPRWQIPATENFSIFASAALGPDAFVLSAVLDGNEYSLDDPYSRFYRYDAGRWVCVELDETLADLLVLHTTGAGGAELLALGQEGQIWFVDGAGAREERIPEAGGDGRYGLLNFLCRSGPDLLAAGQGGQCYRRHDGAWAHDDAGMLAFAPAFHRQRPVDIGKPATLTDLVQLPNGEAYACGNIAIARPALFHRPSLGAPWRWVDLSAGGAAYDFVVPRRMLALSPDDVLIATNKGVLLRGNAHNGFQIATKTATWDGPDRSRGAPIRFRNVVSFEGGLYAGSDLGAFRLDGERWHDIAGPPQLSVYSSEDGTYVDGRLEVVGNVMWAFGARSISRFDGNTWTRIPIPPIYQTPR